MPAIVPSAAWPLLLAFTGTFFARCTVAAFLVEALRRRRQGRAVAVRLVPPSRHHAREAAGTIDFPIQ